MLIFTIISMYQADTRKLLLVEIIISVLILFVILWDISYLSKDVIITNKKIILLPFSHKLIKYPKGIEIILKELTYIDIRNLGTHGTMITFTSKKSYILFAGDIVRLMDFVDYLKKIAPKRCFVHQVYI